MCRAVGSNPTTVTSKAAHLDGLEDVSASAIEESKVVLQVVSRWGCSAEIILIKEPNTANAGADHDPPTTPTAEHTPNGDQWYHHLKTRTARQDTSFHM